LPIHVDLERFLCFVAAIQVAGCRGAKEERNDGVPSTSGPASAAAAPSASDAPTSTDLVTDTSERQSDRPREPVIRDPLPVASGPAPLGDDPKLHRKCDTLPELDGTDAVICKKDRGAKFCHQMVSKHTPEVAEEIIRCLQTEGMPCTECSRVRCEWTGIWKGSLKSFRECDVVGSPPDPYRKSCDIYASSLSRKALARMASCLRRNPKQSWECTSNSAITPCFEGG
jgi:hypothetical protein